MGTQVDRQQTLCWDCANATGGCSWSQSPDHVPVEGWTAIRRDLHNKYSDPVESYIVTACPEFKRDAVRGGAQRWDGRKAVVKVKKVCGDCKHAKDRSGNACYCTKYGIIIGYGKNTCFSFEPKRGSDGEQVRQQKDGD